MGVIATTSDGEYLTTPAVLSPGEAQRRLARQKK